MRAMTTKSDLGLAYFKKIDALNATCRAMLAAGATREAMLATLYYRCADTSTPWPPNPLEAIKVVRAIYGVSLHEALAIVREHPSWAKQAGHILS
jgi:ribosomal protein L7/L12